MPASMTLGKLLRSLFIALLAGASSSALLAVPVIPGGAGFGIETPAGRGGAVRMVTSLEDRGRGTLREALEAAGPRTVIFAVSGNIQLASDLTVEHPYLTVAGQTAPSPGIQVVGASLRIRTHDVLIQHLRIRPGVAHSASGAANRDAVTLIAARGADTYNIVLDHVSLAWSGDGLFDTYAPPGRWVRDVTLINSILAEPLRCPAANETGCLHPKGPHNFGSLVNGARRVTLARNLFVRGDARNPKIGGNATDVALVNNVIYRPGDYANARIRLDSYPGNTAVAVIEGNVVITRTGARNHAAVSLNGAGAVQLYLANNTVLVPFAPGRTLRYAPDDPWTTGPGGVLALNDGRDVAEVRAPRRPASAWPAGLAVLTSDIEAAVLTHAGARPADRDADDRRIVEDVARRAGPDYFDVPPNGGPQRLARNTVLHRLPPQPHADDDGDGYTNLEAWLHARAAEVESGRSPIARHERP